MPETKTGPSLSMLVTYERALAEVLQANRKLAELVAKLRCVERGSEAYYHLTPKIAVVAGIARIKTESVEHLSEEMEDAMPDD